MESVGSFPMRITDPTFRRCKKNVPARVLYRLSGDTGASEREKWSADHALRQREVAVKEAELELTRATHATSRWRSPVVVALLAAAIAALGNAAVAYTNGRSDTRLEAQKSEQARILEMIKTGSPDKAAANLKFLLQAGLISDSTTRQNLTRFLRDRRPGTGPALPSATTGFEASSGTELTAKFEGTLLKPYTSPTGEKFIGTSHRLTPKELHTGKLVIDGTSVDYQNGITRHQAKQLLEADLAPIKKQVDELVTVKLTRNQLAALTDFVFNVGIGMFMSDVLKPLNAGHYDQVPHELLTCCSARSSLGMIRRRQSEVALWNKEVTRAGLAGG
jgi:GH24 family phage-related lysozyme (muramidase)